MKRTIVLSALALTGCVTTSPAELQEISASTPVCHTAASCEMGWASARRWILDHADYRIQTYSADFIETYNPTPNSASIAAHVSKDPVGDGSYKLNASFYCDNMFGCVPSASSTHLNFNREVSAKIAAAEGLAAQKP